MQNGFELKVELIDVVLGEHVRRTQENLAAVDDFEFAQFPGLKLVSPGFSVPSICARMAYDVA
jgi:hypothetical protein